MKQVFSLPMKYIYGLQLAWASNTTLTVGAGQCRDAGNENDLVISTTTTINAAVNGANGLDTGSLANSTMYYVWIIGDSSAYRSTAVMVSTSATAPTMPYGYDQKRLIGYALTDGSARFLKFYQSGVGADRVHAWDAPISVLSAGTSATYAALDLSGAMPAIATDVVLQGSFTPNAAADAASVRPSGSASTTYATVTGVVASKAQSVQLACKTLVVSSVAKVDYVVAASGSLALLVSSFTYSI